MYSLPKCETVCRLSGDSGKRVKKVLGTSIKYQYRVKRVKKENIFLYVTQAFISGAGNVYVKFTLLVEEMGINVFF